MTTDLPWRRISAAACVVLLHAIILLALVLATRLPVRQQIRQFREIVLTLVAPNNASEIRRSLNIPTPRFVRPESAPRAIALPPAAKQNAAPAPEGDMSGVGRYLFNCTGALYERLSAREKQGCLTNNWDRTPKPPLLGPAKPSPFDVILTKRRAPPRQVEKPCPADNPNAHLGLPCFDFAGH